MIEREKLQKTLSGSRGNLLMAIALTTANILLYLFQSDLFFLFSAFVPMITAGIGYEAYMQTGQAFLFTIGAVLAGIMLLIYFFCFLFSKKRPGWLIAALVLFSVDTALLLVFELSAITDSGFNLSSIANILFHFWVLFYLINGVRASSKLKRLPLDPISPEPQMSEDPTAETASPQTTSYTTSEAEHKIH